MKRAYLFTFFTFLMMPLFSQEYPKTRKFSTQQHFRQLLKEQTQYLDTVLQIERHIRSFSKANNGTDKFTIPIVFHVIHNREKLPIDAIQMTAQLEALNRDFGKIRDYISHPADTAAKFLAKAAKVDIQFCLPKYDPTGKITTGINYMPSTLTGWSSPEGIKFESENGVPAWNTQEYLNIWIVDLMDREMAGYAQMPGGPKETDGIVIDPQFFGVKSKDAPFNEGKTLTHLVGSYLGLYELWNETIPCGDDRVEDTPIHNASNQMDTVIHRHISTCNGLPVEMTMNFMDNAYDRHAYIFTLGQIERLRAMLSEGGPRARLNIQKIQCEEPKIEEKAAWLPEVTSADKIGVKVFPNPAKDLINLRVSASESGEFSLVIYNALGAVFYSHQAPLIKGDQLSLEVQSTDWADGLYFIQTDFSGNKSINKIIISR